MNISQNSCSFRAGFKGKEMGEGGAEGEYVLPPLFLADQLIFVTFLSFTVRWGFVHFGVHTGSYELKEGKRSRMASARVTTTPWRSSGSSEALITDTWEDVACDWPRCHISFRSWVRLFEKRLSLRELKPWPQASEKIWPITGPAGTSLSDLVSGFLRRGT